MVGKQLDLFYQDIEEILQFPEVTSVAVENAELDNIIVIFINMHLIEMVKENVGLGILTL